MGWTARSDEASIDSVAGRRLSGEIRTIRVPPRVTPSSFPHTSTPTRTASTARSLSNCCVARSTPRSSSLSPDSRAVSSSLTLYLEQGTTSIRQSGHQWAGTRRSNRTTITSNVRSVLTPNQFQYQADQLMDFNLYNSTDVQRFPVVCFDAKWTQDKPQLGRASAAVRGAEWHRLWAQGAWSRGRWPPRRTPPAARLAGW
jgi:hypothetical protein